MPNKLRELMWVTKALADENRVRLLMALRGGEVCVCQLVALLDLAASTVSKHLSILHQAGLVEARKNGRWIFYSLAGERASSLVAAALAWVEKSLEGDARVVQDDERLREVLARDPGELCRSQLQR